MMIKVQDDAETRKDRIRKTAGYFDRTLDEDEINEIAKDWYKADNTDDKYILEKLSDSPYWEIRESVAGNVSTPLDTLIKLSKDDNWRVRVKAAKNCNLPEKLLSELKNDEEPLVREAVERRIARHDLDNNRYRFTNKKLLT
ncbi:MAG: HEAT repeat domain-containing protein [Ruminococcus sp.]|nr:HEAT repeat domain-containing protein [Ruminococcus sp.]